MQRIYKGILLLLLCTSCHTGKLVTIANFPNSLKETSAIETAVNSNLLWTIEDSGNKNNIYGLDLKGKIVKDIDISNADNIDWEDITSDTSGNLYIGDFGNNSGKRKLFTIYRVSNLNTSKTKADRIDFKLPKKVKSEDFEAFFIWKNTFYIFSKHDKHTYLLKVPNSTGKHKAALITKYKFDAKNAKITAADISPDGKTVVLLNHDKLWKLEHYKNDNFFEGTVKPFYFDHTSQKEGICFSSTDASFVYITDEKANGEGGNLYLFSIND